MSFVEDEHKVFLKTIIPSRNATKTVTSVRSSTMKIDTDEKALLESVERGEWKSAKGGKRARPVLPLRQGHVPQGPAAQHPAVEQGPGGDSEASAR